MKSKIFQWAGIAISLLFVVLLIRSLHLQQVGQAIRSANYWWLIPAIAISLTSFIFRSERFRMFLQGFKKFSLFRAYQYISINYMANNVLPARAGEVLLSYVVKQQEDIPVSSSLAVTILGRVMDGLLLLVGLVAALLFLPFPNWVNQVATLGLIAFGGAFLVLLWLVFGNPAHHTLAQKMIQRITPPFLTKPMHVILTWADEFRSGLLPLKSGRISLLALVISIAIWVCEGMVYWFVAQMFHLHFSLIQTVFILSLANLAASIPSGPAGIGTFEGVVVIGLGLMGIPPNQAAAYALILHVTQVLPITAIGVISYFRLSVLDQPHSKLAEVGPTSPGV